MKIKVMDSKGNLRFLDTEKMYIKKEIGGDNVGIIVKYYVGEKIKKEEKIYGLDEDEKPNQFRIWGNAVDELIEDFSEIELIGFESEEDNEDLSLIKRIKSFFVWW